MKMFVIEVQYCRIYGMANNVEDVKSNADNIFNEFHKKTYEYCYDRDGDFDDFWKDDYVTLYNKFIMALDNLEFSDTIFVDAHY